jgi:hypothetical protein
MIMAPPGDPGEAMTIHQLDCGATAVFSSSALVESVYPSFLHMSWQSFVSVQVSEDTVPW